jgi:hypothetical protein
MPVARNHHSVPQFLLRYFSIGGSGRQIYTFDKSDRRDFKVAIRDAAAETDFNVAEIHGRTINFESAFQAIDDLGAKILRSLVSASSRVLITPEQLSALPSLAAAQLLRTKIQRTSPQELGRQLQQQSARAGVLIDAEITDDTARRISLLRLISGDEVEAYLRAKDIFLLDTDGARRFWISDNPVVLTNSLPYGEFGLSSPGVEIYFPISPTRALAFFCPSIRKQIAESLDPAHPRRRLQDPMYPEMLRAIRDHSTLTVGDSYVDFVNELQTRQSARFLYSDCNQFSLARTVLKRDPDLSAVQSLFTVGEMGRARPRRSAMPPGEWLVVESGTNHHAIPVRTLRGGTAHIEFEPLDYAKVTLALRDAPFDSAILYQDGNQMHGMRDVEFELVTQDGLRIVRVRHVDPGLRMLMEGLAEEQSLGA